MSEQPGRRALRSITLKRDGGELPADELTWLVGAFTRGEMPDYQMSAFAMATVLRGMTDAETLTLTRAMRDSGRSIHLRVPGPKVDKHSTGGVGDKVSLCLAPLMAACGLYVPMICGRGLGHTGGTIDKLESIPGFQSSLPLERFEDIVALVGCAIGAQTEDLAPADRKLYALRDVTATVESIPLITASILSKKLCEDLDALVMDIKVGRGAFMPRLEDARALARSIVSVGRAAGLPTTALLTRMDQPLGRAVGNALEAAEAFKLLCGDGPADLWECTLALGSEMLVAAKVEVDPLSAERKLLAVLRSGAAAQRMEAMISAQHGDPRVVREPDRLPAAPHVVRARAGAAGYVHRLDARALGELAMRLGAGRASLGAAIDPSVGLVLHKKVGDRVMPGDVLAELHLREASATEPSCDALLEAYQIAEGAPQMSPIVIETLRPGA